MAEEDEVVDPACLLDYDTAKSLLTRPGSVFICAEQERCWSRVWTSPHLRDLFPGSVLARLWDTVLFRTFDGDSGSQPNDQWRMLARDARGRLDTRDLRQDTLKVHADHSIWKPTPYISFTDSARELQSLAEFRLTRNRGDQSIIVVDPRVRFEKGLPILHFGDEMQVYGIQSRYRGNHWDNHFLCLWEVTPEEVVGVWDWHALRNNDDWLEGIIMPRVVEYRQERAAHNEPPNVGATEESDGSVDESSEASDSYEDSGGEEVHSDGIWSGSEDSEKRVLNENWTGQLVSMYEDLRLD